MALDPELLERLPDSLVEMYSAVEADILGDMARRIAAYDYFIPAAQHQLQKLQELGTAREEIIARLSAATGQAQAEIVSLLSEAVSEAIADDVEYYTAAEVYEPSKVNTEALYKQLNSGLLQTQQAFFHITGTTADTATKQFEHALDRAWMQISTGAADRSTAVKRAVTDLAEKGIEAVRYPSGRTDSLEAAVRRAVVTGANQTALKTQETLADELDVDLVETTAHGGARPEHAKWQGKAFSRKGRRKIDGVIYEDFAKATGYGRGDGLGGWNCRHSFYPYIPGAPEAYSARQLKDYSAKSIEYNGRRMTEYEASQVQRSIEREIRKQKRTIAALEAAGYDASEYRAKLRAGQKAYTDFTKQTGLKKQSARTQTGAIIEKDIATANHIAETRKKEYNRKIQEITKIIQSDDTPKFINKGNQNKHIPESKGYQKGKGYIYGGLDTAEALVRKYSGTGKPKLTKDGEWTHKEFIEADSIIGIYVDMNTGAEMETNRFSIHYGKNGTHIVPAKRRDETT